MNKKLGILLLIFLTSVFLFLQFSSISKNLDLKSLDLFEKEDLTPLDRKKLIEKFKREMKIAATNLDFELAIIIRDKIRSLGPEV